MNEFLGYALLLKMKIYTTTAGLSTGAPSTTAENPTTICIAGDRERYGQWSAVNTVVLTDSDGAANSPSA